jgi:hypothetical protein
MPCCAKAVEYEPFAVAVGTSGEALVVKSAEDTVLRKLVWFREGGEVSEKQWRDVVSVLRVSGPVMDDAYLRLWASRLHLESLLERARVARSPER